MSLKSLDFMSVFPEIISVSYKATQIAKGPFGTEV